MVAGERTLVPEGTVSPRTIISVVLAAICAGGMAACSDAAAPGAGASAAPSAAATTATPAAPATAAATTVPDRYRTAYAELDTTLGAIEKTLPTTPRLADVGVVSTSLIMVNANQGAALLRPAVLESAKAYLDQMAKIGAKGVEVQISYPVGSKDFANQAAYLRLYRQVVDEAHKRGITVLVETSCIFSNSTFTDIPFDFSRMTPATYFQARSDEIVAIAREVGPDYLSFGEEPVNEKVFAGVQYTPDQYIAFVNTTAAAVRSALGPGSAVRIGVGTGTWEADLFQQFVRQTDLDFYDIHIYPLQGTPSGFDLARSMAKAAATKGKPLIIGETWLYKMASAEIGKTSGATAAEAFRRDAFSFWEPLEERYVRDVLALGAEFKMPFVSFWGARFMFAQLDWTPQLDALDFRGISEQVNPTITANYTSGKRNALGDAFARLLAGR